MSYAVQVSDALIGVGRATSRIREIRRGLETERGKEFSATACAQRAGIPVTTWWSYETGGVDPPATAARAIAQVLGVTFEELDFRAVE